LVSRFHVSDEDAGGAGARLDHFLVSRELPLTRSQVRRLIDAGDVRVNRERVKPGTKLRSGDEVEVVLRPPEPASPIPQAIELRVLFEDAHLIVIDKPAGLVVHPAPGHPDRTLVNALLAHCTDLAGVGGELRPGIVHRLDKDTSGVMVATKDDATHQALAAGFADKRVARTYLAVVAPPPRALEGSFDTLFGRHPKNRKTFSSKVSRGKRAVTHYRALRRFGELAALVSCKLETGRTHQLRVHFADHGSPIVGDPVYGRRRGDRLGELAAAIGRQALHAARLAFDHPITGERLEFETDPPADFRALVEELDRAAASAAR
jgi:23S rRNA pseudouridine1911/1915/1917 synthase